MHTFDRSLKFSAAPDLTATQDCGAAFGGWGGSKLPECSNFQLGGSKRLQCSESRFGIQTGFQIELRNQSWKMLFGATLLLSTRSNFPASAVEASIKKWIRKLSDSRHHYGVAHCMLASFGLQVGSA